MTTFMRHGGEAHVMRPDRVYRTGVLSPMVGYQPQMDVQSVAMSFTQGPPLGTDLRGFGSDGSVMGNLRVRWELFKARAKAGTGKFRAMMMTPAMPKPAAPSQVAPQQAPQMALLANLASRQSGAQRPLQRAMNALTRRRYNTYYRAG